jgi:predicted amidohydrolase YtcJ
MKTFLFPFLSLVLVCASVERVNAGNADMIFLNGNVYTVNERQPKAEALAAKGDRIIFVGSNSDAQKQKGDATRLVDLHGQTVVPGLTDSHCHIFGIGERELKLTLEGSASLGDLLARVKAHVAKTVPGKWVTGRGWIETFWKPPVFPTRADLDKVAPENPVFLRRADGHGAVVNSAAIKIAGIDKETANPFGGEILKDKKTGEPLGMLLDNAMELVAKNIPSPTSADKEKAFLLGVNRSLALGWCEIQNAGSVEDEIQMMRRLYREGEVKLRIYNAVYGPGAPAEKLLKDGPILDGSESRFTQRTIKVVFDGALGSRGAALLAPYADADTSGFLKEKEGILIPMFEEALRRGIQIETHAIGDRANRAILDLYDHAFKAIPPNER